MIFLRPKGSYTYSAAEAVIRIDDEKVAGLAYGGFFCLDLPAGTVTIAASAGGLWSHVCEVQLRAVGGDTVYLEVGPRQVHAAAALLGSIVGGAAAAAALRPHRRSKRSWSSASRTAWAVPSPHRSRAPPGNAAAAAQRIYSVTAA
ncbi:MAG TPA: hypothetical protein VE175_00755 [Woeseiaceae bacterium]|nr:hypothetical protein [Woeseiaceae bacterium]